MAKKRVLIDCASMPPGDALMVSAAIRNICSAHPGEFAFNAMNVHGQAYPDLWLNNPDINPRLDQFHHDMIVKPDYGAYLKESNKAKDMHFAKAMTLALVSHLGVSAPRISDIKPAIYLSDEEKKSAERVVEKPYWVIMPGGKTDIMTKIWPKKHWEALVTRLLPKFVMVQVGAVGKEHFNPELRNVVNMVGKTTLRDLILLIYRSEGVICGVTSGMHVAGAFDKPCVVIAGGREGWWWEKYPNHCYLNTIGKLRCCAEPCWKSHIEPYSFNFADERDKVCGDIVVVGDWRTPACMNAISPDVVERSVLGYAKKPVVPPAVAETMNAMRRRRDAAPKAEKTSICVCLYGTTGEVEIPESKLISYHDLHVRCLGSILKTCQGLNLHFVIGCNEVDPKTLSWLKSSMPRAEIIESKENIHKYPMMRKMFSRDLAASVIWVDDDTVFGRPGWLERVRHMMGARPDSVFGKRCAWDFLKGQDEWIQQSSWFKGKPFLTTERGTYSIIFPTGGFQAIPLSVIRKLDWPDVRLDHNGGDVMFGEACRQNDIQVLDLPVAQLGILVSGASRRGFSQRSAGTSEMRKLACKEPKPTV